MFCLGLIVNPIAGLGGAIALKGSDNITSLTQALSLGAIPHSNPRTLQALQPLQGLDLHIISYPGEMGENAAKEAGFTPMILGSIQTGKTTAKDTEQAAQTLLSKGVDLILFAGGDGTARNICNAVGTSVPVLGIPAGVKIHSGVYAVTPKAAGEIVALLIKGELVTVAKQDVRDIDEEAFRIGNLITKHYGELQVPQEYRYLQAMKESSIEIEELVLDDIAADFADHMQNNIRYIIGSGSTMAAIMKHLGLNNTLLGIDVIENNKVIASDCTAQQLLTLTKNQETRLIITIIGGQGHIIGRGNQQLSPELLMRIGRNNIFIIATKAKLKTLNKRPLIVDSGNEVVNQMLAGMITVHTGYEEFILYRVAQF